MWYISVKTMIQYHIIQTFTQNLIDCFIYFPKCKNSLICNIGEKKEDVNILIYLWQKIFFLMFSLI